MSAQALIGKATMHSFPLHTPEIRSQRKELMLTKQCAPVAVLVVSPAPFLPCLSMAILEEKKAIQKPL